MRTALHADPAGIFLHDAVLASCHTFSERTAIIDTSNGLRLSYAEYGERVEALARGLIAAGVKPGEIIAIYLPNSWEFAATYHAATLVGAVPTLLNPSYREREVRYQLENSGAVLLISDGPHIAGMNLAGLPNLRGVYTSRETLAGALNLSSLLQASPVAMPHPEQSSQETLAALPY